MVADREVPAHLSSRLPEDRDHLPDLEEGGLRVEVAERVDHPERVGARAVVEGQRDLAMARAPA